MTADGLWINIYYSIDIVLFDGVLEALQDPNLRACANVETKCAFWDIIFSLLNLPFQLTSCSLRVKMKM